MHANEALLRHAYDTFIGGGRYSLAEFGDGLIPKVMQATAGTFRESVIDVYANDRGGVVRAHHEFSRDGVPYAYDTLHIYEIRDGKLRSFLEIPEDQRAFDRAWA